MQSFAGKTMVITGGANGIGRGTARALARRGANVVIADIDASAVDETVMEIRAGGGRASGSHTDVTAQSAFDELLESSVAEYGGVDLIMNNVGTITRGLPEHLPEAEWRRMLEINLFSVVRSNLTFIPYFLERGSGHIVNTASFAGLYTYSYDRLPYAASKAAIVQISEGLALYLAPKGIGVTLLCPGPVRTNISASRRDFGPPTITRTPGPEFSKREPDVVGEMVADAVREKKFIVYTDDQVVDHLVARASDWNSYIAEQTQAIVDAAT